MVIYIIMASLCLLRFSFRYVNFHVIIKFLSRCREMLNDGQTIVQLWFFRRSKRVEQRKTCEVSVTASATWWHRNGSRLYSVESPSTFVTGSVCHGFTENIAKYSLFLIFTHLFCRYILLIVLTICHWSRRYFKTAICMHRWFTFWLQIEIGSVQIFFSLYTANISKYVNIADLIKYGTYLVNKLCKI